MKNIKGYRDALNETWKKDILGYELIHAAEVGDLEKAKGLLDGGAEIGMWDNDGWTPLIWAAYKGHGDLARLLLDRGADVYEVDYYDKTPLHFASENGHIDVVRLLLNAGAEVDVEDNDGHTPLWWAVEYGHNKELRMLLILHGADPFKAFKGPDEILKFFNGDIDWMPDRTRSKFVNLKRSKQAFGM